MRLFRVPAERSETGEGEMERWFEGKSAAEIKGPIGYTATESAEPGLVRLLVDSELGVAHILDLT